jgi:hypothetical protein
MLKIASIWGLVALAAIGAGCLRYLPRLPRAFPMNDLAIIDCTLFERCRQGPGAIVHVDQRYDDYWGYGYDPAPYLLTGVIVSRVADRLPAKRRTVRRRVIEILSEYGATQASTFSINHFRWWVPPVEVNVWEETGAYKEIEVSDIRTVPLADWPCVSSYPRRTTFKIEKLAIGDIVEIIQPVSGPDQLYWEFGSSQFCVARSHAELGHKHDLYRPDMDAAVVDATGSVKLVSKPNAYPMTFELNRTLLPISPGRIPFVFLSPRCPSWDRLRGRIFHTVLWLANCGNVAGRLSVNPFLLRPVKDDQRARRIQAIATWMMKRVRIEVDPDSYWMRWLPTEPVYKTARKRRGCAGNWSALAYRIMEDAGLKPRLALIHTHPRIKFRPKLPSPIQFDTLAVVVEDENGLVHWLVPGIGYQQDQQPPEALRGRQALVLKRWWIDRIQGGGSCAPEVVLPFSCQISSPELIELELVTIGQ